MMLKLILLIVLFYDSIYGYRSPSMLRYHHYDTISLSLSKQKDIQTSAMKAKSFKEYLQQYLSQYNTNSSSSISTANDITNKRDKVLMIIDGDNVRGKTKFQLSKEQLSDCVELWMQDCGLHGKVCLMYDHGSVQAGYVLPNSGLAICFSGISIIIDNHHHHHHHYKVLIKK